MIFQEQQRFRLKNENNAEYFVTEVYVNDEWVPASLPAYPVLGLQGAPAETVQWEADYQMLAGGVQVEVTLRVMQPTPLNPALILWLGTLDNLNDRQANTWRSTILRAPTRNQQGLGGNDLPAGYFYDHARGIETIVYVDASAFAWSSHRFYELELREITEYEPQPRYGFGLVRNTPDAAEMFPTGTHTLRWWVTQRPRQTPPSPWEAQRRLIEAITPLLDVRPAIYTDAIPWQEVASRTLEDLYDDACWTSANDVKGLRAYVRGSSKVARDEQHGFELMTQLDVLWPLLLWRQATGSPHADALADGLLATLPLYDRPLQSYVANAFPAHPADSFMDTWYFLENALIKLPWVAYLTGDAALREMFLRARDGAEQLAHNTHDMFPLFADATDWKPRQSVLNVGVSGLYAAGCVLAAQLDKPRSAHYLAEAQRTLRLSLSLPPHMLTHEPQQLTFAAAAASYLASATGDTVWQQHAADFVNLSLRMGYWARDSRVDFYDARGMFQACASLAYSAYKENVETLLAWPELLASDSAVLPRPLMAAWANLQRCHNYAFFDPWLPVEHRTRNGQWIPHENIATHELDHSATFGKEIYGAGEVFWSALMFDTLGYASDADILCLSLDVPCLHLNAMPARGRRFLLYNPTHQQRTTTVITPHKQTPVTLEANAVLLISQEAEPC